MDIVRPNDEIRVGGEIESRCTKCKEVTTHRVVSMKDGVPKTVHCLVCHGDHQYRKPLDVKVVAPVIKPIKVTRKKSTKADPAVILKGEPLEPETSFAPEPDEGLTLSKAKTETKKETTAKKASAVPPAGEKPRGTPGRPRKHPLPVPKVEGAAVEKTEEGKEGKLPKEPKATKLPKELKAPPMLLKESKAQKEAKILKEKLKNESKEKPLKTLKVNPLKADVKIFKEKTVSGSKKSKEGEEALTHNKIWEEAFEGVKDVSKLPVYTIYGAYENGERLRHDFFGLGIVEEVKFPNKITVRFQDGMHVLIMKEVPAEK
ncbi:MAG: hypothetical protein LBF22_14635 [Deltaproteobacteria bacterium]|jgi:hypothetical protein|nr:hypothetical protein [Deltaproteobacteria bacterium]